MKVLLNTLLALILAAVQAALLRQIGGGTFSISLVLPCVVYLGLRASLVQGAFASCLVGYVLDILSGGPKGLQAFLCVLLFLFSRLVGASFDIRWRGGFAVLSAVGTLLVGGGALVLMSYVSMPENAPGARVLGRVLLESVLTGAVAPLIGLLMNRLDRLLEREEPGLLK